MDVGKEWETMASRHLHPPRSRCAISNRDPLPVSITLDPRGGGRGQGRKGDGYTTRVPPYVPVRLRRLCSLRSRLVWGGSRGRPEV